jgi:pimeloyl-ACP methyl ester carboxylesterase
VVRYAADLGVPVLLHHGFLIDFNSLWHRSGVVQQLATDGPEVVLIIEHFLREAGDAHAFGHGTVLLLAEALADVIDELQRPSVDIVAAGAGVAPALVAAANDDRIRRLVLADPADVEFGPGQGRQSLMRRLAPPSPNLTSGYRASITVCRSSRRFQAFA